MSGAPAASELERIEGSGGSVLWVDPAYASDARSLGLLEVGGLERAVAAGGPGGEGRGATAVLALPTHGERLHLRPLRRGGWLAPLLGDRLWRIERPLREVARTKLLRERGAPVPRPVLVSARREGGFWRAAVGTIHEEDSVDVAVLLGGSPPLVTDRTTVARAAGRAIRRFHDLGGHHADLHAGNLLVRREPEGVEVIIVDLDRVGVGARVSTRRRASELTRLERSLHKRALFDALGPEGWEALLDAYTGGDPPLRRSLEGHLRRQRWGLELHRIGYRL